MGLYKNLLQIRIDFSEQFEQIQRKEAKLLATKSLMGMSLKIKGDKFEKMKNDISFVTFRPKT